MMSSTISPHFIGEEVGLGKLNNLAKLHGQNKNVENNTFQIFF